MESFVNGIYIWYSTFVAKREKAIYPTHFVFSWCHWWNEILRPTRSHLCFCLTWSWSFLCQCYRFVMVLPLECWLAPWASACGNKIELQHILNINTHSVHCTLRRLTLLSDKKAIKTRVSASLFDTQTTECRFKTSSHSFTRKTDFSTVHYSRELK